MQSQPSIRSRCHLIKQRSSELNASFLSKLLKSNQVFNDLISVNTVPESRAFGSLCKGGDPAAPSGTATLLRLHPSHETHRGRRPPCG